MQRAVDGDNIALCKHLLEALNTTAANLLLLLRGKGLVVKVEQLLAVEGLETAEHTLTDAADGNGTNDLVLEIILVLRNGSDVPLASGNLLVGGHEVADEGEDGHDDVLGDGHDVGASNLGHGDTAIGLVGSIEVDVVRTDTSSDGNLEVLRLGETFGSQVAGVEAAVPFLSANRNYMVGEGRCGEALLLAEQSGEELRGSCGLRSGNDDFSVNELLVEFGVLALFVRGGDQGVALLLDPFPQAQLVLGGTQKVGLLLSMDAALELLAGTQVQLGCNWPTSYSTRSTLPCCFAVAVSVLIAFG